MLRVEIRDLEVAIFRDLEVAIFRDLEVTISVTLKSQFSMTLKSLFDVNRARIRRSIIDGRDLRSVGLHEIESPPA